MAETKMKPTSQPKPAKNSKTPADNKENAELPCKRHWLLAIEPLFHNRIVQVIGVICLVVILVNVWFAYALNTGRWNWTQPTTLEDLNAPTKTNANNADVAQPTVLPRRVDGTIVAAADANNVPVCVMIENAAFDGVRPQSGISAASLMYEIIVEGGITRWMAVFAGESADPVGPVRSARDTYLEFASELNCAYIHAGGSYSAMLALQEFSMRYIDGLREPRWFWRVAGKYSPHNLFTKTDNLYEAVEVGHSWTDPSDFAMWNFVDDAELDGLRKNDGENAAKENPPEENMSEKNSAGANSNEEQMNEISIEFGGAYNVRYIWNADQKYYERHNGGVPQIDANTGQTLTTRNIVIQHVPSGWFIEGKGRINFSVTGEGQVDIFRNGQYIQGTWRKPDRLSRTQYYDANGDLIPLARGTSWVEIVPEGIGTNWQ